MGRVARPGGYSGANQTWESKRNYSFVIDKGAFMFIAFLALSREWSEGFGLIFSGGMVYIMHELKAMILMCACRVLSSYLANAVAHA